jgi:hypothetical protein
MIVAAFSIDLNGSERFQKYCLPKGCLFQARNSLFEHAGEERLHSAEEPLFLL